MLAPARAAAATASGRCRYPALQSVFDALYPPGVQWYWRADFVNELTDEAIDAHVEHGAQLPTLAVDDAPLPDRRRGAAWATTTPPGATATRTGAR